MIRNQFCHLADAVPYVFNMHFLPPLLLQATTKLPPSKQNPKNSPKSCKTYRKYFEASDKMTVDYYLTSYRDPKSVKLLQYRNNKYSNPVMLIDLNFILPQSLLVILDYHILHQQPLHKD